ncbi:MAG: SelT/SelW/SelH family protein [Haloglomus sp.]
MTRVEIEYCVPCGLLDRAVDLQRNLLALFGQQLETVALRPGDVRESEALPQPIRIFDSEDGGVFIVRVDGEQVFDKSTDEYDEDAIAGAVRERVQADA